MNCVPVTMENLLHSDLTFLSFLPTLFPDSKIADGHSLLVLENIKVKGYQTGNCAAGFNRYDSLKIIEVRTVFVLVANSVICIN